MRWVMVATSWPLRRDRLFPDFFPWVSPARIRKKNSALENSALENSALENSALDFRCNSPANRLGLLANGDPGRPAFQRLQSGTCNSFFGPQVPSRWTV
jgi:hypothetical protein